MAIIKHANASGAAVGIVAGRRLFEGARRRSPKRLWWHRRAGWLRRRELAALIAAGPQADVIIASGFEDEAIGSLRARRKTPRGFSAPLRPSRWDVRFAPSATRRCAECRRVGGTRGGVALSSPRRAEHQQRQDLVVAWRVCARTTSNAIVIARDGVAVGIGAGQQSRVVAAEIAVEKAGDFARGGAAAASDAFFPFADGLESLMKAGVTAVVQPGGSVRDNEVIEAANAAGIVMMLTGERHFRH